ncbi:hypothetical protein Shyhy02_79420 [Streptomyces hygroscopicus subsp. hygroscopicus]|nr:hypothetical protein Shyhy02_79420 [Streptomyces hygroscopicus subsp. hygroscopicus]
MFVVADRTPVQYQDPVGLLDPPPLRLRDEPLVLPVALDDLHVDAEAGSVCDDLDLETLAGQSLADIAAGAHGNLAQQGDARGVVVDVRGEDDDHDDQAEDVHGQATLAARHPLGRIVARRGGGDPSGHVDTLSVQHHQGPVLPSPSTFTDLAAQELVDDLAGSVGPPGDEVAVRRALGRQAVREPGPLTSGPPLAEDHDHNFPHVIDTLVAADRAVPALPPDDHRLDEGPPPVR